MALLVGVAALTLALAMAGAAFHQLNLTNRQGNRVGAINAAEAVVNLAIAELLQPGGQDFGKDRHPVVNWTAHDGHSSGRLSFDPLVEPEAWSTNNLGVDVPVAGCPGTGEVPPGSLQLLGVGRQGGVRVALHVLLHVPPFPYAVASSGRFTSEGGLLVAQLPRDSDPALLGQVPLDLARLDPGNLASSLSQPDSISLQQGDEVLGDVESSGGIALNGARVWGEQRQHTDVTRLPLLDVESYLGQVPEAIATTLVEGSNQPSTLEGFYQAGTHAQPVRLTFPQGLELKNAVLAIHGDVTVQGQGLRGRGALFCTGRLTVEGGAQLAADNQVAVLAGGDVTLSGAGADHGFQGLIYTGGRLEASRMSLTGCLLANGGSQPERGSVKLDRAQVAATPVEDFQAGWLAVLHAWHFDLETQQLAQEPPAGGRVTLSQQGEVQPDGSLHVEWKVAVHTPGSSLSIPPALLRTDSYAADGSFQGSEQHVDFENDPAAITRAFGLQLDPDWDLPTQFLLGLAYAGVGMVANDLAGIMQQQPHLTQPEVEKTVLLGRLDLDFNRLLRLEDKLRVLLWQVL